MWRCNDDELSPSSSLPKPMIALHLHSTNLQRLATEHIQQNHSHTGR